jgi:ribosome-associated protein
VPKLDPAALDPWLEVRFDPASGPGGQHVNKVSTRATVLLNVDACDLFTPTQRERIHRRLGNRITRDGELRVVAQQERSQSANREHAIRRLIELLEQALHVATPRRPTRPTRASQRRRLDAKRRRGQIKRQRQAPPARDD